MAWKSEIRNKPKPPIFPRYFGDAVWWKRDRIFEVFCVRGKRLRIDYPQAAFDECWRKTGSEVEWECWGRPNGGIWVEFVLWERGTTAVSHLAKDGNGREVLVKRFKTAFYKQENDFKREVVQIAGMVRVVALPVVDAIVCPQFFRSRYGTTPRSFSAVYLRYVFIWFGDVWFFGW